MFLIVTRNFPPDIGGIQSLMGGLSESLLNIGFKKSQATHRSQTEALEQLTKGDVQGWTSIYTD